MSPFTVHLKHRIYLISYTPIQNKVFFFKLSMDCEDAGGEPAFSAEKTKSRSQKERNRERGELWTLFFFSKNFIEVWLIFNIALSSAAQECDSVIHIQKYIFFFLSFFMWFMTGYLIFFLMLYSRTLLFFIPLFHQLPVLHSPHPSS